jgi:hypothetical protein
MNLSKRGTYTPVAGKCQQFFCFKPGSQVE